MMLIRSKKDRGKDEIYVSHRGFFGFTMSYAWREVLGPYIYGTLIAIALLALALLGLHVAGHDTSALLTNFGKNAHFVLLILLALYHLYLAVKKSTSLGKDKKH